MEVIIVQIIDEKFKDVWVNYVLQSAIATVVVFLVLTILTSMEKLIIVAAMGSTAFIVFALPKTPTAEPRRVIGGHFLCSLVGWLSILLFPQHFLIAASLSVGLAVFVMATTNTEHPPAAGTALGIVVAGFSVKLFLFIILSAVILAASKRLLDPWLKDLL